MGSSDVVSLGRDGFSLSLERVLTHGAFISGKTGAGKSNTVSVVMEEILGQGFPILVVDMEGEYFGLKESFEVLHVGADEECDLVVGPEHAEKIALLGLEQNVPVILDVSGFIDEERRNDLVREVLEVLFVKEKKLKKPFPVFVEEIHEVCPQSPNPGELGRVIIRVAKRGRKRGLGLWGVSQRPANVHKDVITQAKMLFWHRLTYPNDVKVVKDVYKDREGIDAGEAAKKVSGLGTGEALVDVDWVTGVEVVEVRRKSTFDAGSTPGLGEFRRPELKPVSPSVLEELEEISRRERKRRDRVQVLENQVEKLRGVLEEREEELERARDMSSMAKQFTEALTASTGEAGEELRSKVEEIRGEKNAEIRELRREREELRSRVEELRGEVQGLRGEVGELERYERFGERYEEAQEALTRLCEALEVEVDERESKRLREKLQRERLRVKKLEEEIDELNRDGGLGESGFRDRVSFLKNEAVSAAVQKAGEKTSYRERHVWDAVMILAENGECTLSDMVPLMDVSKKSVSSILARLRECGVTKKRREGKTVLHDLHIEGLKQIVANQRRREELERVKSELRERRKDVQP